MWTKVEKGGVCGVNKTFLTHASHPIASSPALSSWLALITPTSPSPLPAHTPPAPQPAHQLA